MCDGSASSSIEGRIAALERCKSASADEQLSFDGSRAVTPATLKGYIRSLALVRTNSQDKNSLPARLSTLADKMPSLHTSAHTLPAAAAIFHGPHALCPVRLPCGLFTACISPSAFPLVYSSTKSPPLMFHDDDLMAGSKLDRILQCVTTGDADND
ncbi:hypothetical protein K488DRAFT_92210 [Vararia minispora EC-137]|uniref:Uncharacterized protein n=1 Tax=Vararia minispora EC-137 TaxID=1314806 RepID=A0ACB8Q588_9AGAM|nr:hypothetical protein K488DRAFT_92210 [Vararia minispora EC-137]